MTVMAAVLRQQGGTLVERYGRAVAANYGSAASETAVCRTGVGIAERSDRATLEVRGPAAEVERALAELSVVGERAWFAQMSPGRAIVRCDGEHEGLVSAAMIRAEGVAVVDVSDEHATIELIGPLAGELLIAAGLDEDEPMVTFTGSDGWVELVVARAHGPALWNRLLDSGAPLGVACVGLEALEHLAVSEHLNGLRRPTANVGAGAA